MKKLFASLRIIAVRTRPPPSPLPSPPGEGTCFDYVLNPLNADVAFDCQRVLALPRGEGGGHRGRAVQRHHWRAIRLGLLLVLAGSHMAEWGETTKTSIIPKPHYETWIGPHEGFLAEAG